jgi:SAM-dependent methyltransferase
MVRLDLGTGSKRSGSLRLARAPSDDTDALATLDGGLPFQDNSIDEVFVGYTLEHAADFVGALEELWRVSKPGALIHIFLPHATSPWATSRDPRHQRQYTIETFEFFDPRRGSPECSVTASFEIEQAQLYLTSRRGGARGRGIARGAVSRIFEAVANRDRGMQYRWERWLGNLIGFEEFYVLLSAVKARP